MSALYKFVSSKTSVLALARGSLKFTRIDDLNDPSEMSILMNDGAVGESLTKIRQFGYSKEQFSWLHHQGELLARLSPETKILSAPRTVEQANILLRSNIYDNIEYMRTSLFRTIALMRLRVGILSLTENYASLPMWAHYAANAAGYLVKFEGLKQVFAGDDTGSLNALKPVRYVEDLVGLTHDPSTQDNLFFCKFRDWEYEREWRVVRVLSDCDSDSMPGLFLNHIDPSHITNVFAGWKVAREEAEQLALELQAINPDMKFGIASLLRGKVNLHQP
ncbi:DUF2971 domain-containing protein [Mesorhizobium sp. IMUNJ 23232]|uniref:DUF2971 domain-containing protein n=1 Tax=Mesorhizobium sp. IMUNJ 23232 TaxID=3376064 RepID=UPI00379D054E